MSNSCPNLSSFKCLGNIHFQIRCSVAFLTKIYSNKYNGFSQILIYSKSSLSLLVLDGDFLFLLFQLFYLLLIAFPSHLLFPLLFLNGLERELLCLTGTHSWLLLWIADLFILLEKSLKWLAGNHFRLDVFDFSNS